MTGVKVERLSFDILEEKKKLEKVERKKKKEEKKSGSEKCPRI